MNTQPPPDHTLVLLRCRQGDKGHALGLRSGDILIGVDGKTWRGGTTALQARMNNADRPSALSFQRGSAVFTVMTGCANLGTWQRIAMPEAGAGLPARPDGLSNWEIVVDARGNHDLFAHGPSLLALLLPPLWLAKSRLWTGLALFGAIVALAVPVGLPLVVCVWLAAGLHLWRDGAAHQRVNLQMQGYARAGTIAARSEAEAVASWLGLVPEARFRFAPPVRSAGPQSELG